MEVRAERRRFDRLIDLMIGKPPDELHPRWRAARLTFEEVAESSEFPIAGFINIDVAQQLIDDLWRAGLRPTEGAGSAGAMAATQRHLDDMRALVFEGVEAKK